MSAVPPPPSPNPPTGPSGFQAGRFVFGALVVLAGLAWLLEVTDVWQVPWRVVLPVALIVLGIALVLASRTGSGTGGLIALGIVLTVVLAAGTVVDIPFEGGIGERVERPVVLSDRTYELAIGQLTVDLRRAVPGPAAGEVEIRARVGIGQLVVIVPAGIAVDVRARAGVGETTVFSEQHGGLGVDYRTPQTAVTPVLRLDLSVGVGEVDVRRD